MYDKSETEISNFNLTTDREIDSLDKESDIIVLVKDKRFAIISTIISSLYTLTWAILFTLIIEDENKDSCDSIVFNWGRIFYSGFYLSAFISILTMVLQIGFKKNSSRVEKVLLVRMIINYVFSYFMVISATVVYSKYANKGCSKVKKLFLGFIISEWILAGGCTITFITIIIITLCCKAKRRQWDGQGEVDAREIQRLYKP
ncbi:MAG: hypothetical protein MJ252_27485 [archaeon]|nr:hypothetical protein [archaeon]